LSSVGFDDPGNPPKLDVPLIEVAPIGIEEVSGGNGHPHSVGKSLGSHGLPG
jgi:hypothetical protein